MPNNAGGGLRPLADASAGCRKCRSPTRLFNWLVFNVLTGNGDAHLKNLSFGVSHEGVQLAPHYDLLSTACYDSPAYDKTGWPSHSALAWPILDVSRFADIERAVGIAVLTPTCLPHFVGWGERSDAQHPPQGKPLPSFPTSLSPALVCDLLLDWNRMQNRSRSVIPVMFASILLTSALSARSVSGSEAFRPGRDPVTGNRRETAHA